MPASRLSSALLVGTLGIFGFLQSTAHAGGAAPTPAACPAAGESTRDCPWADLSRRWQGLTGEEKTLKGFQALLKANAPELVNALATDQRQRKNWEPLWGRSINFDELAQGQIVSPELMDALIESTGAPKRDGLHVHAGLEHVTGYLFSTLVTPYGFKRARWVDGDIERGLGLPAGLFLPGKREDTALVNLSVLLGTIALGDDAKAKEHIAALAPHASTEIRARLKKEFTGQRLTEDTTLEEGGKTFAIQLRTDFIPFTSRAESGNSALLIYSIRDSRDGRSRLITAFPVKDDFLTKGLDPAGLGADKEIKLRYNAWMEGWGEPKSTVRKGTRAVAKIAVKADGKGK